jgi:Fe-S-cluster containining protein
MPLPARDAELVQIVDASLADAARRAGPWLACRPGCTQCCHGAFPINALDVARLQIALHAADPQTAETLRQRARDWLEIYGPRFPGDPDTGILGTSDEDQTRFETFADDAPCPALNPATGLCDVYAHRPMTCRVFGPPTRMGGGDDQNPSLGCCDLCFVDATEGEIAACEMPVPHDLEAELLAEAGDSGETLVAFALLR